MASMMERRSVCACVFNVLETFNVCAAAMCAVEIKFPLSNAKVVWPPISRNYDFDIF